MSKATVVTIKSTEVNQYEKIVRACMTAAKACEQLGDMDRARLFAEQKNWASLHFDTTLRL